MAKTDFKTPEDYLATFDGEDRTGLEAIREAIRSGVPEAEEVISYQIPAFRTADGWIFYYSVHTKHFALACPPPWTERDAFKAELAGYTMSKSSIQIPKNQPLPLKLIADMAAFRARENAARATAKPAKKAAKG